MFIPGLHVDHVSLEYGMDENREKTDGYSRSEDVQMVISDRKWS